MDFYFNTNMDSTYAKIYFTLVCFYPNEQILHDFHY
jgi:hypothetical protein